MARFDVYANPFPEDRVHTPYVVDVQNDHLGPLATHVVIPLRTPKSFVAPARNLNPQFAVNGKEVVLDTASLAPVPTSMLRKPVAHADAWSGDIVEALDTLFGTY